MSVGANLWATRETMEFAATTALSLLLSIRLKWDGGRGKCVRVPRGNIVLVEQTA